MDIKTLFMSNKIKHLALLALAFLALNFNLHAQEGDVESGKKFFKQNCAACHFPDKDMTGPALKGSRDRWIENSSEENFYKWVKNSKSVVDGGDSYGNSLFKKWKNITMPPQNVSDEQIDNIFAYIESYAPAVVETAGDTEVAQVGEKKTSSLYWWLLAGLLIVVIAVISGVKGNLAALSRDQDDEEQPEHLSASQSARAWAWKNRGWFGVTVFVATILLLSMGMTKWLDLGVYENYKPVQPIAYSHQIHAGDLGIDCNYCHNAVTKSRHATIPSVNVCMNCHKTVHEGRSEEGTAEIAKIHKLKIKINNLNIY